MPNRSKENVAPNDTFTKSIEASIPRLEKLLDTWFGRPKKAGGQVERGYDTVPRGAEPRPEEEEPSAAAEYTAKIDALDEEQLQRRFEEMLVSTRAAARCTESYAREGRSKFEKPSDYVTYLLQPELSVGKLHGCLENLRISLTNNPLSWIEDFGTKGIESLLTTLNLCYTNDSRYDRVQYECIRCLSAILNNTVGIRTMFDCREALPVLARSLDHRKPTCALEASKRHCSTMFDCREALPVLAKSLDHRKPTCALEASKNGCMQLMNAIITEPEELEFRIHLRSEFMRTGLYDLIDDLRAGAEGSRQIQMTVFDTHASADQDEFLARFDDV
ncbi:putative diaphanous, partial [Operophtera brumata]